MRKKAAAQPFTSTGYAARRLAEMQAAVPSPRAWLTDTLWLGGLAAAAAVAWRALAAHPAAQLAVAGYLAVEALFYLWGRKRLRHMSRLHPSPDTSRLQLQFERFLQLRDVFCIRQFLSGWFMGADPELVLRGNVEDFVAYGFHCQLLHQLSGTEQAAIVRFVDDVEAAWGLRFQPGFNPDLPFMAHLWEPLRAYHKLLLVFVVTELCARAAHLLVLLMGFRRRRQGGFTFWVAPAAAGGSSAGDGGDAFSPPMSPPAGARWGSGQLRRQSMGEAVGGAVHHAAEHALDATLTVTSAAAAVVAAQHPHGAPTPLSPRGPSPVGGLPLAAAMAPAAGPAAAAWRRRKGDSAADFSGGDLLAAAAVERATEPAAAAAGSEEYEDVAAAAANGQRSPFGAFRLSPLEAAAPSGPAPSSASPTDSASAAAGEGRGTRPDVPIVFIHGVGFGVLPYLHIVREIQHACANTPVIMLEVPHVALRLCREAREVDDAAHAVAALLRARGHRRACIIGHSYGSFVASRIVQLHPRLVHSVCMLDPVAMLTCYPQLLYNFVYKEPSAANFTSVLGALDLLRYICSRDQTIAQAICRKFCWADLMLWPQDLPRRSLVVLSGRDDLVPTELVRAHIKLTGHPAKIQYDPELGHGGILLSPAFQAEFVGNLRAMLAR